MITDQHIKLLYVKEALYRHGDHLMDLLSAAIVKKKLRDKDELLESLSFDVVEDFAGRMILRVSFVNHGRFIEIRYHKSKNQKKWAEQRRNDVWGIERKKKKNTQWYARNVYGSVNRLITILREEFSEQEQARLKGLLERELNLFGKIKSIKI